MKRLGQEFMQLLVMVWQGFTVDNEKCDASICLFPFCELDRCSSCSYQSTSSRFRL